MCIFIGCWPWSIKRHTHRWRRINAISRQRICFSFYMPKNPSINHLNFYCIKQIDKIFPCVWTVIYYIYYIYYIYLKMHTEVTLLYKCDLSQMTSQRAKNKKVLRHSTSSRLVLSCSLHAVTSSVIYYSTHMEKCYLFVNISLNKMYIVYNIVLWLLLIVRFNFDCITVCAFVKCVMFWL